MQHIKQTLYILLINQNFGEEEWKTNSLLSQVPFQSLCIKKTLNTSKGESSTIGMVICCAYWRQNFKYTSNILCWVQREITVSQAV